MWHALPNPNLGAMNAFDAVVRRQQIARPHSFPDLRNSAQVFVTSDYGGEHKATKYETYSFVYLADASWPRFEAKRKHFRAKHRLASRSFAFKKLGDRRKLDALDSFLELFDDLIGVSVTVLVHKDAGSLFNQTGLNDAAEAAGMWPDTKIAAATFEKLLRIVHLNSFFLAGLIGEHQNLFWFTDQDAIAANEDRLGILTDIFSIVFSNYLRKNENELKFPLGHFRCGTTASDNGTLQIEDLAAVPDLVAGAVTDVFSRHESDGTSPRSKLLVPPPTDIPIKTQRIMNWLSDSRPRFKRYVYAIEPAESGNLNFKHLHLHGSACKQLRCRPTWFLR